MWAGDESLEALIVEGQTSLLLLNNRNERSAYDVSRTLINGEVQQIARLTWWQGPTNCKGCSIVG